MDSDSDSSTRAQPDDSYSYDRFIARLNLSGGCGRIKENCLYSTAGGVNLFVDVTLNGETLPWYRLHLAVIDTLNLNPGAARAAPPVSSAPGVMSADVPVGDDPDNLGLSPHERSEGDNSDDGLTRAKAAGLNTVCAAWHDHVASSITGRYHDLPRNRFMHFEAGFTAGRMRRPMVLVEHRGVQADGPPRDRVRLPDHQWLRGAGIGGFERFLDDMQGWGQWWTQQDNRLKPSARNVQEHLMQLTLYQTFYGGWYEIICSVECATRTLWGEARTVWPYHRSTMDPGLKIHLSHGIEAFHSS